MDSDMGRGYGHKECDQICGIIIAALELNMTHPGQ